MSLQAWMIFLGVWTVVALFVAIAIGHMVPREDNDRQEAALAPVGPNVKYFRRKKRAAGSRAAARNLLKSDASHRSVTPATLHRKH